MKNQKMLIIAAIILALAITSGYPQINSSRSADNTDIEHLMKIERGDDPMVEAKIDSILAHMTLEEKAGQMLHINLIQTNADSNQYPADFPTLDSLKLISFAEKYGIGFMINDMAISSDKWVTIMKQLQDVYRRHSRLYIPFIYAVCHQHGAGFLDNSTIFPHNINIAATFDTVHAFNTAHVTTLETAHLGHNFIYVPVMDIGRNPRWPRFYETFGESFLLCSAMGRAMVRGIQENKEIAPYKVAACAKHFIGYSDPRSGFDRTPAVIPDQELYEFYVPSFQACIDAGVKIIEINSGEVNGIPAHASRELVTGLLRGKMNFRGVVNSDWGDVKMLVTNHRVAENEKEASLLVLQAGIDCVLTAGDDLFARYVCELVREKRVTEKRIDLSVQRILRLKFDLGLFDGNDHFITKPQNIRTASSVAKARDAARQSLVLLKNSGELLPLDPTKCRRIIVAGPNAKSINSLPGAWTLRWQESGESYMPKYVKSIYQSIRIEFPNSQVTTVETATAEKFKQADVIIYVAGEKPYAETEGSISDLTLPADQLAEISHAVASDVPVVLIMNAGRPRIIADLFDDVEAFIWAGLPGYEGGAAIAELLSGRINPSGKLPFAYPFGISHIIPYNHKFSEAIQTTARKDRWCMANFGEGLSYTRFTYSNLTTSDSVVHGNNPLNAQVTVTNIGKREGMEAVLFFVTDEVASITRPVRELKHFTKISLLPGASRTCRFTIIPDKHLAFPDEHGDLLLEEGWFTLSTGSEKIRFRYSKN